MKRTFYSFLMAAGVCCVLAACSNGDYDANPASNANGSINPITPLDSAQFDWAANGANPMSATINGGGWVAKNAYWILDDTTGANIITGFNGKQAFEFSLPNVYSVNIYTLARQNNTYDRYGVYTSDDSSFAPIYYYRSDSGNSGEVQILQNDATRIRGLFYFQGVNSTGDVVNITNGYFNVAKF